MQYGSVPLLSNKYEFYLSGIASGDDKSLYDLYVDLGQQIFKYVLSITRDYQLAEDVAHDTFISIKQSAHTYQKGSNPKAWIFTIARNLAVKTMQKRNNELVSENEVFEFVIDETKMTTNTDSDFIIKALSHLDDLEQEILKLHIYGDLKHYEIGKILNLPYTKVRSIYAYSLKKLRKVMRKEEYYD